MGAACDERFIILFDSFIFYKLISYKSASASANGRPTVASKAE
jgi:hypothetical protein